MSVSPRVRRCHKLARQGLHLTGVIAEMREGALQLGLYPELLLNCMSCEFAAGLSVIDHETIGSEECRARHSGLACEVDDMTCPPEIAEIITEIIKVAVLQVRSAGWSGDANRCAIEADHVHNLPELLNHYSREALRYYWEVEKPAFVSQTPAADLTAFLPLWEKLGGVLARHADLALAQ